MITCYRPISLLSVVYKLLERLLLQHIQPLIEEVTPINQAGFRQHRSCTEQVMALTTHGIAVTYQAMTFDEWLNNLEADIEVLNQFFHRWCLQPNPAKTKMCLFHLNTHAANIQLDVMVNGTSIKHFDHPKYLGVTLYRMLTFNTHLEKAAKKVSSRVNLVRKLAGTKWGSNAQTLRTESLALVYSSVEYCAPVWLNSAHVHKLDIQLNNVMRLINGTVKSTELEWLPVLSNIGPPKLRREAALFRE
jgi:hypothetical protein